jgi:uncharacterized protein (TIGR03437 family)
VRNIDVRTKPRAVTIRFMRPFRFVTVFLFLLLPAASAVVITLGPSSQSVTFTGTGVNATGAGTSSISWGSCVYDGSNTTCTVSGTYTGLGSGGTYSFVLDYAGNGASPLSAVASPPGSNLVYYSLSAGSFVFTITPNGGSPVRFYDLTEALFFDPSTDSCTGVSACSVGAVGMTIGGTITGPVNGTFDTTPVINTGGIVTATEYGGFSTIAPATFIEIYGLNLSTTFDLDWSNAFNGTQAPTSLGGTTATVGGLPAYVQFVSPHQVNLLVPSQVALGQQQVVVTTIGGSSVATSVTVDAIAPGMLAPPAFKGSADQYVFALFPDYMTYVLPPGIEPGLPTQRAKPGDVLIFCGLGFGPVTPNLTAGTLVEQNNTLSSFQASIGRVPATVQFAGLVQTYTGLYQFNITVPNVPASDTTPFTFSIDGTNGVQSLLLAIGD